MGAVQRGTFALGEPSAADATVKQAILPGLAEPAGDGEVFGAAPGENGASGIQATESREAVHGSGCRLQEEDTIRLGLQL
jgi:hypothetical protein